MSRKQGRIQIRCEQRLECPEAEREELNVCNQQKKWESGSRTFSVALFKQLHNKPLYAITVATNFFLYISIKYAQEQTQ